MPANDAFEFCTTPAIVDDFILRGFETYRFHDSWDQLLIDDERSFGSFYGPIEKPRMDGDGLIGRQGPGSGCPDDEVCSRNVGGKLSLRVLHRKFYINGGR